MSMMGSSTAGPDEIRVGDEVFLRWPGETSDAPRIRRAVAAAENGGVVMFGQGYFDTREDS